MEYFLIGIAILLIVVLAMSYHFARVVVYPRVHPYQEVYDSKVEAGVLDAEAWHDWKKEEVWVDSKYGYQLHGFWLPKEESIGTVILVHGITVNLFASVRYVSSYWNRGFNVLLYDHRNHGKSGGKVTTFGFAEKNDLKTMVDWVVTKSGGKGIIGTHGESLGAATCLMHAAIDDRLAFVVEDCGYGNLVNLFKFRLKEDSRFAGWAVLQVGSIIIHMLAGFWPKKINPEMLIAGVEVPIFFIHGAADTYIPPVHAERLYAAKQNGYRKLWLVPNANHAMSQIENPETYNQKIGEFLKEIEVID